MNDANPPSPATVDRACPAACGPDRFWSAPRSSGTTFRSTAPPPRWSLRRCSFRTQTPRWRQFFPSPPSRSASLARPLGGVVMGHFGDRIGRKKVLVLALLLMGSSDVPGRRPFRPPPRSVVWAPILLVLLRLIQGFGVGGEWGGAVSDCCGIRTPRTAAASTAVCRRSVCLLAFCWRRPSCSAPRRSPGTNSWCGGGEFPSC